MLHCKQSFLNYKIESKEDSHDSPAGEAVRQVLRVVGFAVCDGRFGRPADVRRRAGPDAQADGGNAGQLPGHQPGSPGGLGKRAGGDRVLIGADRNSSLVTDAGDAGHWHSGVAQERPDRLLGPRGVRIHPGVRQAGELPRKAAVRPRHGVAETIPPNPRLPTGRLPAVSFQILFS